MKHTKDFTVLIPFNKTVWNGARKEYIHLGDLEISGKGYMKDGEFDWDPEEVRLVSPGVSQNIPLVLFEMVHEIKEDNRINDAVIDYLEYLFNKQDETPAEVEESPSILAMFGALFNPLRIGA